MKDNIWTETSLVSAEWLASHLPDQDLVVLDASVLKQAGAQGRRTWRSGAEGFEGDGHVPGARFADLVGAFSDGAAPFSFTRPSAGRFAAAAGALGLSNRHRIVCYDTTDGIWAARLWWLLRAFGHGAAAVLDGGLAAWRGAGGALETGAAEFRPEVFTVRERPGYFVDQRDVAAIVAGRAPGRLVCVLRPPVFAGAEQSYARPGHIPGSLNLPYGDLLEGDRRFLDRARLRRQLAPLVEPGERIVLYCGGGITAAGTALALDLIGVEPVAVYDGSLAEWSADPALPMATLPLS